MVMDSYAWSSPAAFTAADGTVRVVVCDSVGRVFLLDGGTGQAGFFARLQQNHHNQRHAGNGLQNRQNRLENFHVDTSLRASGGSR